MENSVNFQVTKWEIMKNCEYTNNCLSKIVILCIVTGVEEIYTDCNPEVSTILVRVSIKDEDIFLNRAVNIEVMQGIFPYKFNSRKKNNISRLQDLHDYLCAITHNNFPKESLESLIKEYISSVNLLKTVT